MNAVYIIDDDSDVRRATSQFVKALGYRNHPFASGSDFLDALPYLEPGCMLVDLRLGDMSGVDLLRATASRRAEFPAALVTGHADIETTVEAMRAGAQDVLQKPTDPQRLGHVLQRAAQGLETITKPSLDGSIPALAREHCLTERQVAVLRRLVDGQSNKQIAIDLAISPRTVEMHRATVMAKLGVKSLPALLQVLVAATMSQSETIQVLARTG